MNNHNNKVSFRCLEVIQPIGTFYIGVLSSDELLKLAYTDVRSLVEDTGNDLEKYTGIQRQLSPARIKELKKYVNLVDATFPTSVIVHANQEDVQYDSTTGTITFLRSEGDVLQVLDGQHRLAGLEAFGGEEGNKFQINVTLFVGMDIEDQAIVFATINKSHTKVNKSLVADLFEFATTRSPQKTAHDIVRALNEQKNSPFKDKIKILGPANDPTKETITQATFVDSLLKYITSDPASDRDLYKRKRKPEKLSEKQLPKRIFRNMFISEKDDDIARILWRYFAAVRDKWPNAWNEVQKEMILNKSTGFIALMRFLKPVYLHLVDGKIGTVPSREEFTDIFDRIDLKEEDLNRTNYIPGSTGQSQLFKDLVRKSGLSES